MRKIKKTVITGVSMAVPLASMATPIYADGGATTTVAAKQVLPGQVQEESVKWGEPTDLSDNITGLDPADRVDVLDPGDVKTVGKKNGRVKVTFSDGQTQEVDIPIDVQKDPLVKEIETFKGTNPDYTKAFDLENGDSVNAISAADVSTIGLSFAKVQLTKNGQSPSTHYVPVHVKEKPAVSQDTEADRFVPDVSDEIIHPGENYDITDNVKNLPPGATVVEVGRVNVENPGTQVAKIKITFADRSVKEVNVNIIVKAKSHSVRPEDVKDEEVNLNGPINLTDNIKNLPDGATIEEIDKPKTDKAGTFYGKVRIKYKDGKTEEVSVRVIVKEAYKIPQSDVRDEEVEVGGRVDLTDNIRNLPNGAKVREIDVPRTNKEGTFYGKIEVTFADGTKQTLEVKVIVTEDYYIRSSDIIDEEVEVGGRVDLTNNIKNLPSGAKIREIDVPKTDKAGTFYGKVRVTFKNGTSKTVEVKVIVKEKGAKSVLAADIIREDISVGGLISLSDNVRNLPAGSRVEPISIPNTDIPGEFTAKARVVYPDGSSVEVNIPITIRANQTALAPAPLATPNGNVANQSAFPDEEPIKGEIVKTSDLSEKGTMHKLLVLSGAALGAIGISSFFKKK